MEPVKIKPLWGMKPGKWLTILYLIIITLAVFLIGFLPGILNGRMRVSFTSPAGVSAVYIDGRYAGGTPFTAWVPSGEHRIEFKVYGNTIETATLKVGHPLFLTWVFPRNMKFTGAQTVNPSLSAEIHRQFLSDVLAQSAVIQYDETHHYPPLFTDFAALGLPVDQDAMELAFACITSSQMLSDAKAAAATMKLDYDFSLQDALFLGQTSPSGSSESSTQSESSPSTPANPSAPAAPAAPDSPVAPAASSSPAASASPAAYSEHSAHSAAELASKFAASQTPIETTITLSDDTLNAGPLAFTGKKVSKGIFSMGQPSRSFDYQSSVSALANVQNNTEFSISDFEVSEYQYALFLEANPQWKKDNLETLKSEGKADDYYLAGVNTSLLFPSNKSIRNISHQAAQAFCDWLSQQSGRTIFLPTEEQWSAAFSALSAISEPQQQKSLLVTSKSGSLDSMLGGVWEMTSTDFIPLSRAFRILDPAAHDKLMESAARLRLSGSKIIKGGSYLKEDDGSSVGLIDPSECSDTTGFRIAWI